MLTFALVLYQRRLPPPTVSTSVPLVLAHYRSHANTLR